MGLKRNTVISNLMQISEANQLETAAIRKDRTIPSGKSVQPALFLN